MGVDSIDMNAAFPKDPYPLPYINCLTNGSSGYHTLSFMDAYSGYNRIQIDPLDILKTDFMLNCGNYYYSIMPFDIMNVDATYQRLMGIVFSH